MLSLLIILGCFLRPLEPIKVNVGLNENLQDTDSVAEQYMFTTLPDVFSIRSVMTQRSTMQTNNAVTDYPTISHLADTARYVTLSKIYLFTLSHMHSTDKVL